MDSGEANMKSKDPAVDLAERAIRQWQFRETISTQHDAPPAAAPGAVQIEQALDISSLTVGFAAGFLGAITSLAWNIAGAAALGVEPLRLLRIYATIIEGPTALDSRADFFVFAFLLHLAVGGILGAVFVIAARKLCCARLARYVWTGIGYGIAVWLINFYGVLSWLQPLLHGKAFILAEIPMAVAALTHISYGLTVAVVTYAFQNHFRLSK
jgi:hypothetical protein